MRDQLTIAVTGLNATDNPAPGVAVIRSLRAAPDFHGRVVGLAYDSLDPGLYCDELDLAAAFLIPYPSQGLEALRERLFEIHARVPFDVLMPTLDSELPSMIVKKDGTRQLFDRQKLLRGLLKACEKRPIAVSKLEEIVEEVESRLQERPDREMKAAEIGELVMDRLRALDKVAYVRFASVYREFRDVLEFKQELEEQLKEK